VPDAIAVPIGDADLFLNGALRLRQPAKGHRAGTDAVLLAAAVANPQGRLVDAGSGVGAAGLMLAQRAPELDITLIEIDSLTAQLARENVALNGLETRARVVEADLLSAARRNAAGLVNNCADIVITNPPWLAPGRSRPSPDARRTLAHVAGVDGLHGWMRAVAALAKPHARMALITHAQDLQALLDACAGRFGNLAILPVHPHAGAPAIRLLVSGEKGSRAAPRILQGLVLHEADGAFTPLASALHRGEATLDIG
jgi:tRNA1(Val) A37 N6-methylase TrmN6